MCVIARGNDFCLLLDSEAFGKNYNIDYLYNGPVLIQQLINEALTRNRIESKYLHMLIIFKME